MVRSLVATCHGLAHRLLAGPVQNTPVAGWSALVARAARIADRHPRVLAQPSCGVCDSVRLQPAVVGRRPIGLRLQPTGRRLPFGVMRLPLIYRRCEDCGAARIAPTFQDAWIDDFDRRAPVSTDCHWMEDPGYVEDKQRSILAHCERADVARFRSARNSVLDVSCGAGVGLAVLRDRLGWQDCRGIECDPAAVRIAREQRGLDLAHGLLHTVDLPAGHFDLVVMDNSLEHHARPRQALQRVRHTLRTGGAVLIVVPNFHGHSVEQMGIDYWNMNWGHWHYFTARSLAHLLAATSFRLERVYCSGVEAVTLGRCGGVSPADAHTDLDGATVGTLTAHERRLRGDYVTALAVAT